MLKSYYNLYFSKQKAFARELKTILGFLPKHLPFYDRAFTHKSTANKQAEAKHSFDNERLEYLGDAILDAVIAEYLFRKYPTEDEGFLTQMRSKIVSRKTLNRVGAEMGLDDFLKARGLQRISPTVMGNCFEAFVGAIYLDKGYKAARKFIIYKMLQNHVDVHLLERIDNNFKSILLEFCQKDQKSLSYELIEQQKNDGKNKHSRQHRFKVAVLIDEKALAEATGPNKKTAEQNASKQALIKLGVVDKNGHKKE